MLSLACTAGGCASTPQSDRLARTDDDRFVVPVTLTLPFFPQQQYHCGPAALATILSATGVAITPDELVDAVFVPGVHGTYQPELIAASRSSGRLPYVIEPSLTHLLREIQAGNPVLVLQNLGLSALPQWHYAVVKGFDLDRNVLILNSGTTEDYEVSPRLFERTWARADYWGLVVTAPGDIPATADPAAVFSALAALDETGFSAGLEDYYQAALRRWPEDPQLLMGYGNLLYEANRTEEAAAAFRRILHTLPDYAPAHNNLAYLLYEQERYEEALIHSTAALNSGGQFNEHYRQTHSLILESLSGP